MLPLLFKSSNEFLLEFPKQNIGSLYFPLESLVGTLKINCGLCKLQRNMIDMIAEFRVIIVTVGRDPIECLLESAHLHHDLLPEPLRGIQPLPDVKDLLPVLIKQCLGISKHLIDLMIHLRYLGDILIIIILDNVDNLLLLLV